MTGFNYKKNALSADNVRLEAIAQDYGTPLYIYSAQQIARNYKTLHDALQNALGTVPLIAFAVKANSNLAVIKTLSDLGAGADLVSGGELTRALRAGVSPDKIVFSGVGKSKDELRAAMMSNIHQINIESEFELDHLIALTDELQKDIAIAVRINPNVDAKTHAKITTGKAENKFGVNLELAPALYARAAASKHVKAVGVAIHIGSQLLDVQPFREAFQITADFIQQLRALGHEISRVDLGGGLGIVYDKETPPNLDEYALAIKEIIQPLNAEIMLAPGRFLVGNAGVLLSRVIGVKRGTARNYLILDAAMNDLARPTLYDAYHDILPVHQSAANETKYDVVGPVCETGDTFAVQRALPEMQEGDLVALMTSGAYGAVMSSMYNSRALIPEVLVDGENHKLIRRALTLEDQLALEVS